ncbi:unnamed protein product (macronuclear) [Paramecium tetraurelia]|uniref:Uncharacterized protein n=1 Tax=Paramecium tetraurelia TaxID=5888 RepID=A0BDP6_PARTE|nr:uncharacterized protein GSPATT00027693001 [Paramecium tetraurelia]CAK56663.1 unnamed protein product [Paramecium tetraurelia]|eukprot:XP_001424061.1 hypothetical protein (macronuclear) [Paramecium tetraurelia strain d4-2]
MLNKSIKVTKKVIIINQKTDTISENTNLINREPSKNGGEVQKTNQKNSNQTQMNNEIDQCKICVIRKERCDLRQLQEMIDIYLKNNQKIKEIKSIVDSLKNRTSKLEQQMRQQEGRYKVKRKRNIKFKLVIIISSVSQRIVRRVMGPWCP